MLTFTYGDGIQDFNLGQDTPAASANVPNLPARPYDPSFMEKVQDSLPEISALMLPRVQKLLAEMRKNIEKSRTAERNATLIGVGGGVLGAGLGMSVGRWASPNKGVAVVGAGTAALGLGLLGFFVSRRLLMPPTHVATAIAAAVGNAAIEAAGAAASKAGAPTPAAGGFGYAYTM